MTFLPSRGHIGLELEAVAGVGETVIDADVIHPVFDPVWTPNFEVAERELVQNSFSRVKRIQGERTANISFSIELRGSGSLGVAPTFGKALQASTFLETIVPVTSVAYTPISQALQTATVEYRMGGLGTDVRTRRIVGAHGTVTIEATKGETVKLNFNFLGQYAEPTDAATQFTTPALGVDPLAFLNAAITMHGIGTLLVSQISLDIGNNLIARNDANEATGNSRALIVGRTPVGSFDPEQVLNSVLNFYDRVTMNTEGVLQYILNGGAGNISQVDAPAVQFTNLAEADREGVGTHDIELALNQSAAIGDDELSFLFT